MNTRQYGLILTLMLGIVMPLPLPAAEYGLQGTIAAQYETRSIQLARRPQSGTHRWNLLRSAAQVEVWNEGDNQHQRWWQDDDGSIGYSRLFTQQRKSVDYTAGDLRALGRYPARQQLHSVIDPALLGRLRQTGSVAVLGREAQRYQGQVDGVDMEVWWLADLALPALVRRVYGDREVSIHLLSLRVAGAGASVFADTANYDHLDYADLGDMESDPFVQQLQLAEGGHRH